MSEKPFVPPVGKPTMGAHAMGIGAMVADLDYFAGYPITPQTELLEYVAEALPEQGGVFQQLGDEISSVMAVFGAAACGKRAMTASVGPGLTLMIDGLTNAAGAETPMVLGALTRAHVGVSGGLYPAQSDIRMLRGLGNGDYQLPLFAPSTITETVQLTAEAFDVADLYSIPAVVCIDGKMANMIETLQPFEVPERDLPDKTWALDRSLREKRRVVGAARTPELDTMVCYEIQHKLERMRAEETRWDSFRCDDAEFVVVAYGIMARIAKEAVRNAREEGIKVGLFRPITLFPFPEDPLGELASSAREVLTVEINFGQVLTDVRLAVAGRCPVQFFGQPALAIPARAVLEAIRQMAAGQPVEPRGFHDVHPTAFHLADTHPPARKQMLDQLAARRGHEGGQAMLDNLLGIRKNTVIPEVGRD